MENKEVVGPGKYVTFSYKLYNEADGSLLFETKPGVPDEMVYGVSQEIVPGLIAAMQGLGVGDKFEVVLPPVAAFGDRHQENVITLDKEIFSRDGKLAEEVKEGVDLPMMTAEGFRVTGHVVKIDDSGVLMDFNHPFAGLTVKYEGKVEGVREATAEELHPTQGCGCGSCGSGGCGGNGCGSDSQDCGCGSDSCGCGDSCGCEEGKDCGCGNC